MNRTKLKLLLVTVVAVLLVPSVSWAAATISWTSPGVIRAGLGAVSQTILSLAVKGSFLARGGNFICENSANPNCGFVSGTRPAFVPMDGVSTATGGLTHYGLLRVTSPYDSTASTRGLKTGTGIIRWGHFDVVRNPTGLPLTCGITQSTKFTATGSWRVILVSKAAAATGAVIQLKYQSGALIGPTEEMRCASLTAPTASTRIEFHGATEYTNLVN